MGVPWAVGCSGVTSLYSPQQRPSPPGAASPVCWEAILRSVYPESPFGPPWWLSSREPARQCRRCGFDPWGGKIPWRRAWQPTPVVLSGKPMDRGAWQATVHGVAKSQTRLRQLGTEPWKGPASVPLANAASEHSGSSPVVGGGGGRCCRPHRPTAQMKLRGQVPTSTAHLWLCLERPARQPALWLHPS